MSNSILQQAMQLAALGLAVHWLRSPSWGGKAPVRRAWQSVPWQSPEQLRRSYRDWFNVGIHTGAVSGARYPVVVLDLDSAEALRWALQHLPRTPMRVITRRGEHWYYLRPVGGARLPNRAHIAKQAKDVRADEGQVVCPPSRHPSGHIYSWAEEPSASMLAVLPSWDPSWFPAPQLAFSLPSAQLGASRARLVGRAIARAKHWPVAEENTGRGTQTFLLAAILVRELQLDPATAFNILAEHYNPRLPQPYGEDLLRRKVSEAQRTSTSARSARMSEARP